MIHQKNEERKEIVQSIYEEAKTMVDPEKKVRFWPRKAGIWRSGYRCWSFVGRTRADSYRSYIEDGRAKGSARSVEAVDILKPWIPTEIFFIAFGGHAGAAGMTLEVEKLSDLSQVLKIISVKRRRC